MFCPICLGPSNASALKMKCCKQQFHVSCLDQWVKEDKFSCPICQDEGNFLVSLPFQKFKLFNAGSEQSLPNSYKGQVASRVLLTNALDEMFELGSKWSFTSNEVIEAGRIIVRIDKSTVKGRVLRSSRDEDGFLFDYKGGQVWINVEYRSKTTNSVKFNIVLDDA
jgi:hypothetical protein